MPALFVFTLTSEQKMLHRMGEVAEETEHAIRSVEWADHEHRKKVMGEDVELQQKAQELRKMYRQSILQSGVRVVDTPTLQWYHQGANYVQANPFKVILGIGVPAILGIFYGKSGKEHCTYWHVHWISVFGISLYCLILTYIYPSHFHPPIHLKNLSIVTNDDPAHAGIRTVFRCLYFTGSHGSQGHDG
jgi:ElaB/YqjD/DUF883 family membrane-anchored ribosome-binding protein